MKHFRYKATFDDGGLYLWKEEPRYNPYSRLFFPTKPKSCIHLIGKIDKMFVTMDKHKVYTISTTLRIKDKYWGSSINDEYNFNPINTAFVEKEEDNAFLDEFFDDLF